MTNPMMTCGHTAQGKLTMRAGVALDPPIPYCGVCECETVDEAPPSLEGRTARCGYYSHCRHEEPSAYTLAFFEYNGAGSRAATEYCRCGYQRVAHEIGLAHDCKAFEPRGPREHDTYYCGCYGWD